MTAPGDYTSTNGRPELKAWTVMILFAGDNDLAALLVSQVKAIKDAGFNENVDVILHIDPSERGVPTRLLHVNRLRRNNSGQGARSRSGSNSYIWNIGEDTITAEDLKGATGAYAKRMKKALESPDKVKADRALENFLGYCREQHPAENYMLFLFGHGLVVGNDAFLPDENPRSGIKLPQLGSILGTFSEEVEKDGAELHLVGMHSCAMSAIEVAYELKGTAKFMIGAEGIAYVGSWPYRNLLLETFNAVKEAQKKSAELNVSHLVEDLYIHALHNGTDFVYMGYSLDLALCSLEPRRYEKLTEKIRGLVSALKAALKTERGKEMILLAHWEAQSYWDENYTDLYDFCLCLGRRCGKLLDSLNECASLLRAEGGGGESPQWAQEFKKRPEVVALDRLVAACEGVKGCLEETQSVNSKDGDGPVIYAKNIGSQYQYSHGLSVYFPWSKPLDDEPPPPPPLAIQSCKSTPCGTAAGVLRNYRAYKFSDSEEGFGADTWLSFLKDYFQKTMRTSRPEEERQPELRTPTKKASPRRKASKGKGPCPPPFVTELRNSHARGALEKPTGGTEKPTGGSGSTCTCPSIKNYPTERLLLNGKNVEVKTFYANDPLLEGKEWPRGR